MHLQYSYKLVSRQYVLYLNKYNRFKTIIVNQIAQSDNRSIQYFFFFNKPSIRG